MIAKFSFCAEKDWPYDFFAKYHFSVKWAFCFGLIDFCAIDIWPRDRGYRSSLSTTVAAASNLRMSIAMRTYVDKGLLSLLLLENVRRERGFLGNVVWVYANKMGISRISKFHVIRGMEIFQYTYLGSNLKLNSYSDFDKHAMIKVVMQIFGKSLILYSTVC